VGKLLKLQDKHVWVWDIAHVDSVVYFELVIITLAKPGIPLITSPAQSNLGKATSQSPHWLQWDAPVTPKTAPSVQRSPPSSTSSTDPTHHSKWHPNPLSHFATLHIADRQTDRQTDHRVPSHKPLTLAWCRAMRLIIILIEVIITPIKWIRFVAHIKTRSIRQRMSFTRTLRALPSLLDPSVDL